MTTPNNQDILLSDEELQMKLSELLGYGDFQWLIRDSLVRDDIDAYDKIVEIDGIVELINTQKRLFAESVERSHRCPRPISKGNKSYGARV